MVTALAALGTAALIAASEPIARLILNPTGAPAHASLGPAITAFAFGLLGWSLVALLARMLYAARRVPVAAGAQVVGWVVAVVAELILSSALPSHDRAVALALGNAIGVSIAAVLLAVAALRIGLLAGGELTLDCLRAAISAAVGALAGWAVAVVCGSAGVAGSLVIAAAAGTVAIVFAGAALATLDRSLVSTARTVLARRSALG